MIIIADSGSTKTQWVVLDKSKIVLDLTTKGFNPFYYSASELERTLFNELQGELEADKVEEVFFYGAGCSNSDNCTMISSSLKKFFTQAVIHTEHDLTGAGVALLQDQPGIACILGTGSNSCMWDGEKVTGQLPSLGWMLADEGSGTYIGKLLLQKILSQETCPELAGKFYKTYNLTFETSLHKIYSEPNPNRFLASLSKFASENIKFEACQNAVKESFCDFVEKQISKYHDYQNQVVSFTGSVAYVFQDILKEVLAEHKIKPGVILKNPMEGMVLYHTR